MNEKDRKEIITLWYLVLKAYHESEIAKHQYKIAKAEYKHTKRLNK